MTNRKTTRRALVMSLLSLLLCCSMLVGTTFAWFTDSVTSGKNKIIAGNLDVELYYKLNANDKWAKVTSETELFDDAALWEPGYTQVVYLKVANEGTLALKYQLGVNIIAETQGKNVDNEMFKLSDYIKFDAIETAEEKFYDDRAAARAAVTDPQIISAGYGKASKLLAAEEGKESAEYVTLVVYMPEETDNKANYREIKPEITLGVNLVATQLNAEEDSFNSNYDKDASYPGEANTAEELIAALNEGKNVKLGNDIDLTGFTWKPIASYSGVFDGNGYTISNLTVNSTEADVGMFASLSGATVKNLNLENVNISTTGNRAGAVAGQIAKDANAPQTVIENVTVSGAVSGNYYTGGIVGADRSYNTLIKNCVNNAAVTGNQQCGGIVGQANRLTVIDTCSNSGEIKANIIIAGGIVGMIAGDDKGGNAHLRVSVKNCANTGAISDSQGNLVGGIAGAIGRDGGDPIVDTITAVIVDCTVADGQKLYGAKYNYCSGKDEKITVITDDNAITSAEELAALGGTKINGTYMLLADIDMASTAMKPMEVSGGAEVIFEGNGHTISNLALGAAGIHGMTGTDNEVAGLFDLTAPATTVSLTVNDLTVKDATVECDGYAAAIVGYNPNGGTVINLNDVDVDGATVNADTVGALIGYTTGKANLNGCDVSDLSLTGETGRDDKVGAYVGTANGESCAVTVVDCTNNTTYRDYGRVIYGATWNGGQPVSTTTDLIKAIKAAPVGEVTTIYLASGTYADDMDITVAALGTSGGDVVIKAMDGATPVITGTVTLGYRNQGVGATMYNANVTFEGVTFDHAENGKNSLNVQDVKSLNLTDCKIIGDGETGIESASGNGTGASRITGCTFENAAIQGLGNWCTGLVIEKCTFNNSRVNIQGGNGVTIQECTFNNTLTDAHVDDSFYLIRTNSTPITVKNCKAYIDSTVSSVITTEQAKWYLLANRGTTNWTVTDVEITMTDAALAQDQLKVTACTSSGIINTTNLSVNGVVK